MLVFFDVDTQKDFMNEDGALYVPKAENIKPLLKQLTDYALENDILILATSDSHYGHEEEMSCNGGPFPLHCMMNTPGYERISETSVEDSLVIQTDHAYTGVKTKGQILFQKQCYDVFAERGGNDDLAKFIERAKINIAVVYGVATDYCVKAAVLGLIENGVNVLLVADAIMGVDVNEGDSVAAIGEMTRAGAKMITAEEVFSGKHFS